ncbi:MAG: hypothetical protein P0Y55_03080 [Candidatus Cohnella colombiensis]|uniref:AAA domain-containing protein n=1 Tax=Candidatus Cohnella colombiensis TaxID=3121368 RepID=A0AA95EY59_9BACL|nr:MAG: hypothetical protein P0Y55_03080 [Cohnella sp.]
MGTRVILAVPQWEYASKLADYLREEEPTWEIAAFTHISAMRMELDNHRKSVDLLVGQLEMLEELNVASDEVKRIIALVESNGDAGGKWTELLQYQPLTTLLSAIRNEVTSRVVQAREGCKVITVFSASGGIGKTTTSLNMIRQAGERGLATFYLNLETLNATAILFGQGEPDRLSRLLYVLQAYPDKWDEQFQQLRRHQPQLRTDFIDAPDHPGERLALSSELLETLITRIRDSGKYNLIVVDPDSGATDWHCKLLELSDVIVWLTIDDRQSMSKAKQLLHYWQEQNAALTDKSMFILNKALGTGLVNAWSLPGEEPATCLPYIPQWKASDQPSRMIGSPVFCGAVDELLDQLGITKRTASVRRRKEEHHDGAHRVDARGIS